MLTILSPLMVLALAFNGYVNPPAPGTIPAETFTNVPYGSDPKQKMDVYLPANRHPNSTKLLIVIHGGAWNGGDKRDLSPYITELQKRLPDYAFANINYRLFNLNSGNNRFPAQEKDIEAAIKFLNDKSSEYKISDTIALLGASAGGHLALLQGYKFSNSKNIRAVISFFGPTDLIELYHNSKHPGIPFLLNALTGTTPEENKTLYQEASPIHFVTAQSPPTLLLHGGQDMLVPENQPVLLRKKLKDLSVAHRYVYYPNEGHGWRGNNLLDSLDKVADFLEKHI